MFMEQSNQTGRSGAMSCLWSRGISQVNLELGLVYGAEELVNPELGVDYGAEEPLNLELGVDYGAEEPDR